MADALGRTRRSLNNYKRLDPEEEVAPPGRPPLPEEKRRADEEMVRAELDRQGWHVGEGRVLEAIGCVISRYRVQMALAKLKKDYRARQDAHRRAARVSVEVRARDAIWSMDATLLGRDVFGCAVQGEVVREAATTLTLDISVGPEATAEDVVEILERVAERRGIYPLVLQTDNDGTYTSEHVRAWCREHSVMPLLNFPHTPQHNPRAENGIGEIKADAQLGKGVVVRDIPYVCARLESTRARLNEHRLRATRGWMTAVEADQAMPHWTDFATRGDVLEVASCLRAIGLLNCTGGRARRRVEREAILAALQYFAMITRTRGGLPIPPPFAEVFS